MPDRWSQLERDRNRKPWDTFGHPLNRARGQAPSTSRNSDRMEQWSGGRNKYVGRRGKKKLKQDQRVKRQRRTNEEERRAELRRRPALAKKAAKKIADVARFCEEGYVVSAHKKGTKPHSSHIFTVDGLVEKRERIYRYDEVTGRRIGVDLVPTKIRPWNEMHSRFLRKILRSAWMPEQPKHVLDSIIIATSENHGS